MRQEFEVPSGYSPVATPYKWEAAPGRPIVVATTVEQWTSPLRPPPGARSAITKPFHGFEPEPPAKRDTELAGKVLKKLNRLRRKSIAAGACFTSDASRVSHQHSQRHFAMADADFESAVSRRSVQPNTPHSSTSVESTFMASTAAAPSFPCAWPSSPHRCSCDDDGEGSGDGDATLPLPGPSESAWHQPHGHGDETSSVPAHEWQMRRSYGDLVSTFLRQSTTSRSFPSLILVRTFGKSKAAKRLNFET